MKLAVWKDGKELQGKRVVFGICFPILVQPKEASTRIVIFELAHTCTFKDITADVHLCLVLRCRFAFYHSKGTKTPF